MPTTQSAAPLSTARPADLPDKNPTVDFWNDVLTPKWLRFRTLLSAAGAVHSDLARASMELQPGDRVLDVACGFGESCLELGDAVGPGGEVLGIDCTHAFIDIAERERDDADVNHVHYRVADAETCALPSESYDLAFSRFGLMFFASPVRAMRNLRAALVPGAWLHAITWRALADNPCWADAEAIALSHLPTPGDDAVSCGPGPFSMSDRATVLRMLHASGFVDAALERIDAPICVGRTVDEAVAYAMTVGPAGFVVRTAGERGQKALPDVLRDLRLHFDAHRRDDGSVWLASSTWHVRARAPQ